MKVFLFLSAALAVAFAAEDKYTDKYDSVDVVAILGNDRLFNNYFKCLINKGPCPSDGAELKRILPDALQTGCSKCNEKQKADAEKVIHHLIDNRKEMWGQLEAIYDPDGTYKKKYQAEAQKHNIQL